MLKIKNTLYTVLILLSVVTITACGGGGGGDDSPDLTPEEQRLLDMAGANGTTWTATSITFAGAPAEGFDNFSLTLRGTDPAATLSYSSVDGDPIFNSSGTWEFVGSNINQIIIDGNTNNLFNIGSFDAETTPAVMTLTVNFTAGGGVAAGQAGTDGLYVFNLEAR